MILTESFAINSKELQFYFYDALYTGLSSCLVTSYNDNFCKAVIGSTDSCMPVFQRQRVAREDLLVSQKVRKHLLKLHLMPIKSLSSSSASVALDIKKLSDPFRTAPDILPNGLQSLPLSTQQKLYVCVFVWIHDMLKQC